MSRDMQNKLIKDIVICDIDGTISKVGKRLRYLNETPANWDKFFEHCSEDEPIEEICTLVCNLYLAGYTIIFCTGRICDVQEKTVNWIKKHVLENLNPRLLMRRTNDYRSDTEVKPELIVEHLTTDERKRISFILDDRDSMVEKWRELGYICLQVARGNY